MKIIKDTLVSDDLLTVSFCCNLVACKGACCVDGDAGAPLEEEEISILEDYLDKVKPYMTEDGIKEVEKQGVFDYDEEGSYVTLLVNNNECAFVYFENGISFCAIEKAWSEKQFDFQKPISCHLYPVRLSQLKDIIAVNYHKWEVCNPALDKGNQLQIPVYKFLKIPLIRKFGEDWYQKLEAEVKLKKQTGLITPTYRK
ncbi:MAG: DUF3109 family protein [Bacteroidetes bacterium]|nr:DUF3109 family protein [Bacteroidota bacterium]